MYVARNGMTDQKWSEVIGAVAFRKRMVNVLNVRVHVARGIFKFRGGKRFVNATQRMGRQFFSPFFHLIVEE